MLYVAILGAALAVADTPEERKKRFPAPEPPPPATIDIDAWLYPGATVFGGSGNGGIVGDPPRAEENGTYMATTPDDFDRVVRFFYKVGAVPPELVNGTKGNTHVMDDSRGRPVRLKIISKRMGNISVTVVVSRAEGEKLTHIAWSYSIPRPPRGR